MLQGPRCLQVLSASRARRRMRAGVQGAHQLCRPPSVSALGRAQVLLSLQAACVSPGPPRLLRPRPSLPCDSEKPGPLPPACPGGPGDQAHQQTQRSASPQGNQRKPEDRCVSPGAVSHAHPGVPAVCSSAPPPGPSASLPRAPCCSQFLPPHSDPVTQTRMQ